MRKGFWGWTRALEPEEFQVAPLILTDVYNHARRNDDDDDDWLARYTAADGSCTCGCARGALCIRRDYGR